MDDEIRRILGEIRPELDFESSADFMADRLLDSYDMIVLIAELEESFKVNIDGMEVLPENFASVRAISALVERSRRLA